MGTRPWYSLDTFDQNKIILIAKLELICLRQKMFNEYNHDYRDEYSTIQHWTNVEIHVLSQFFKLVAKLLVVSSSSLWSNNGHATEMSGGNLYEADSQDFKSFGFYDLIYQWMQPCLCQEVKKAHFVETRYIILFPACFRTFCCSFELSFYYSKSVISSKLKFQAIFPVYFLYGVNLNVSQSLNLCILTRRILQCRLKSM